jgi:hypothetical protein
MLASRMAETARHMIVYQPTGLHEGVADGGANKFEPALFQCL